MRGIYLEAELVHSAALRGLSRWAMQVYLHFLTKRVMVKHRSKSKAVKHSIGNNGDIVFCYSEAEKMGIGRREFRNSLDELIVKGFIDINHQGAGGRSKDMSTYFLCDRWKKWNTPEYKPTQKPRIKDTRLGHGWAIVNARKKQSSVTNMSPVKPLSIGENVTPKGKKKVFQVTDMSLEKTQEMASSP
ncbi:MAG: hypothetical protein AUK28_06770 [Desulfobacterales bacterium CG2_30_60_27]|nr:MAG: hypothetical protein AUK28_06770 [Desulfobacterales bacterium CG2_30_60_27]